MSDRERLACLTNLLYGLSAVMFGGTILELLFAKHYQEPVQLVPFALCGAGIVAISLAWTRPGLATVQGLRIFMLVTASGTLLGIWKHLEGNIGFIREMHPETSGWPLIAGALTGRAPLLASGVLAAGAITAIAGTFAAGWSLRGSGAVPRALGDRSETSTARPSWKYGNGEMTTTRVRRILTGAVVGALGVTEAAAQTTDVASAGNAGVATASANGGAVGIGDTNSGGNAGNAIGVGDSWGGGVGVDGGSVGNATTLGVSAHGGTGIADASGGDYNLAFVS